MSIFFRLFPPALPAEPAPARSAPALPLGAGQFAFAGLADLEQGLASYCGYEREAAVRACGALADPRVLPLLASRLNDWVPQVREAARAALMTLLAQLPPSASLAILPRVQHLLNAGRTDHRAWVDAFEQELIRVAGVQALLQRVHDADHAVARASFRLLRQHGACTVAELIGAIGRNWNDVMLAIQGVRLCVRLPPDQRSVLCRMALASPFGSVRMLALQAMIDIDISSDEWLPAARAALLDANSSVRAVAKPFMARHGVDLRAFYRTAARQPDQKARQVVTALAGLASLRNPEDIAFLRTFTTHGCQSVRAQALTEWLHLAPGDKDDIALAALMDVSRTGRKLSLQMVCKQRTYIPMALVSARLAATGDMDMLASFAERLGSGGMARTNGR
ncbi:hypothetical protein F2P44_27910 [Massilia sp. CCM 8695]|uniref:HEAT repeat domain-containing protein n=1 Tax=Massilia frigida TaxID=2609281 RepID=A0ABX0NCP8_9BURK|nr:hypothetical protein [Massilia frigida]NHZ83073.1 hypothetical protein [Massilia frigida]